MSRIPRQGDFTNTWDFMSIKERKRTDREYASYIDYKTIGLLFCLMTVMAGLQSLGVFKKAGERLLGDVKGPGAVSAVLVLQTIAANLGRMLMLYTAVSLGMLGSCLAVAGREEQDAGKGEKRRGTGGHGQRSSRIFRGLQCADCGDESGSASCAGFVGFPL